MTQRRKQRGVTLIELLVALAIVGLAAAVAVMSAPPPHGPARAEADRFAARLAAATDEVIVSGRTISLRATASGYSFDAYIGGKWLPVTGDAALRAHQLSKGVVMSLDIADPALANENSDERGGDKARRVVFDPIGLGVSFTAEFADRRERWRVSFDDNGGIKVSDHASRVS